MIDHRSYTNIWSFIYSFAKQNKVRYRLRTHTNHSRKYVCKRTLWTTNFFYEIGGKQLISIHTCSILFLLLSFKTAFSSNIINFTLISLPYHVFQGEMVLSQKFRIMMGRKGTYKLIFWMPPASPSPPQKKQQQQQQQIQNERSVPCLTTT